MRKGKKKKKHVGVTINSRQGKYEINKHFDKKKIMIYEEIK